MQYLSQKGNCKTRRSCLSSIEKLTVQQQHPNAKVPIIFGRFSTRSEGQKKGIRVIMESGILVATQLSSLFPVQTNSIPLQTARQDIPLPPAPNDSDPPLEHATYSSTLNHPSTGTVLLRVLHSGLIVELVSLSTEVLPVRFVFPSPVLPSPAIFVREPNEIHLLAVTDTGSLYRAIIPIGPSLSLWNDHITDIWPMEYAIRTTPGTSNCLSHVHGIDSVILGMPSGSILRLESSYEQAPDDSWNESFFQHGSFLSSLTSFLPSLNAGNTSGSDTISITSHPWPTDIGHVWSLSRDRTLRLWKAKVGCVASKVLPYGKEASPTPGHGTKQQLLLDPTPQALLRVFTMPSIDEHIFVVAFIPTISLPGAGGTFHLVDTYSDTLNEVGLIEASNHTAHCHLQDFIIADGYLVALWDKQGQSFVEKTPINLPHVHGNFRPSPWHNARYAAEPELTPAYLEEHLLSPGSMAEKFFEAIMRPGMFSALTLRTAIDQYIEACLALPGPRPPQLSTAFTSIGEQIVGVVGCTVNLQRDPQTGAYQYANYWNALRRDWEGFIARCREVERSARRPLALGVQGHDVLIIERERVGTMVIEDLPLLLRRQVLTPNVILDPQYQLLSILWTLRSKLGPQVVLTVEARLSEILTQEVAFSLPDILQDQSRRLKFKEQIDEGFGSWMLGRLQSVEDLDAATRTMLDVIGGFDIEVKQEEDEVELLLPPSHSDWSRAITEAYIIKTVEARYELAFSVVILLFFLADDLSDWDPSLIAEIFAVYRGTAMLRLVTRQPIGAILRSPEEGDSDDVVSRLRNMNVSASRTYITPTFSLIYHLLQSGDTPGLPGAAHRFLDTTGLLQSVSPAHATKYEVQFCERLRLLGITQTARDLLSYLPRTAGASYVLARLWITLGRPEDAAFLLEKLAGVFVNELSLNLEDRETLGLVLPATELIGSQFSFYTHGAQLFRVTSHVYYEVRFAQHALSVAPSDADVSGVWTSIIQGFTELGFFEDAHTSLMTTPYDFVKKDCIAPLVYRMCEDNAVNTLMSFDFAGQADEVEAALAFKARNADPFITPSYSQILYTWFTRRSDYRNAALAMYQRARRLHDLSKDATTFSASAKDQLDAYNVAINALSLVDPKNAWVLMPCSSESPHEPRKRRKVTMHIPEEQYTPGHLDEDVVHLKDMQYDCSLLSAQIDMINRDPQLLSSPDFLLPPTIIILRLAQANRFNSAMTTARALDVDMTDLFGHLTRQCLRLSRNPDAVMQEDTSDWLLTDKVSSWPGTPADRGWRFLRQSLQQHDNADTDYKYSKAVLETILSIEKSTPPPWLVQILEKHHHEYLIRINLRYDNLEQAIEYTLSLIRKNQAQLARDAPRNACSTWLPYTLIDQVLVAAQSQEATITLHGLAALRMEMTSHVKRMQKLSQFA